LAVLKYVPELVQLVGVVVVVVAICLVSVVAGLIVAGLVLFGYGVLLEGRRSAASASNDSTEG
jgi:hypothetical protein